MQGPISCFLEYIFENFWGFNPKKKKKLRNIFNELKFLNCVYLRALIIISLKNILGFFKDFLGSHFDLLVFRESWFYKNIFSFNFKNIFLYFPELGNLKHFFMEFFARISRIIQDFYTHRVFFF